MITHSEKDLNKIQLGNGFQNSPRKVFLNCYDTKDQLAAFLKCVREISGIGAGLTNTALGDTEDAGLEIPTR